MSIVLSLCHFCCADAGLAGLRRAAMVRRRQARRPSTRRNWDSMQVTFVLFCQEFGVDWSRPSLDDVGAFVELLVRSSKSMGTIKNYV